MRGSMTPAIPCKSQFIRSLARSFDFAEYRGDQDRRGSTAALKIHLRRSQIRHLPNDRTLGIRQTRRIGKGKSESHIGKRHRTFG